MNSIDKSLANIKNILENLPKSWLELTTHRLDIYNEEQAKSEFLKQLKKQLNAGNFLASSLEELPTAYDYIRLGHQLSSILEWLLAEINALPDEQVISFSSKTMPILAILRKNALTGLPTSIYYNTDNSPLIDCPRLEQIYGYQFTLHKISNATEIPVKKEGTVIYVTQSAYKMPLNLSSNDNSNVDITVNLHPLYGSVLFIHNIHLSNIVKDVQHVRRRETIAMTPPNTLKVLQEIVDQNEILSQEEQVQGNKIEALDLIFDSIKHNTGSTLTPLIASSGLSIQYAIMMGLVENALNLYPGKPIKIILPPNCYGGTNDQARRIADLVANVSIVDLLVDGGQNLVASLDIALQQVAESDSVPLVLAEIPTNPRVEVPDMPKLAKVLSKKRTNQHNQRAVEPIFMVDQTFCPNVKLLDTQSELAAVKIISFTSGSKFPSGGRCIAGYCAANNAAMSLLAIIERHLILSDNAAIAHQLTTLAENMPSMPQRIKGAYYKTREFVLFIQKLLPQSKMYFVSDEIAERGFTPSVFSLDLPAKGETKAQQVDNQKELNKRLIKFMIKSHPNDCKNCVSYGQLKGSYWTIPATSTQGTTKENDKDYVVRVALSADVDVAKLSQSFADFCSIEKLI